MSTEQREAPLDLGATEHQGAVEATQGGIQSATVGEPETPARTGAVDGSRETAGAPATARRVRRRDEDLAAPAGSDAEGLAATQPDSQQREQDEERPATRRRFNLQDSAGDEAPSIVDGWRPGQAAERRQAAEEAEQAARQQRYREAFEEYQRVGAWLRGLEEARARRAQTAVEEAEERDERLVESFLSRYAANRRYQPTLLAAIAGHPDRRGQLLEVLRKEPRSAHEYLERITVKRLYAEAKAEAEAAVAEAPAAEAGAEAEA